MRSASADEQLAAARFPRSLYSLAYTARETQRRPAMRRHCCYCQHVERRVVWNFPQHPQLGPESDGSLTLKILAGYDIAFNCSQDVPMLLMLSVHPIVGWRVWAYIPKAHAGRAGAVEISSIGLAGQRNVLSFDRPRRSATVSQAPAPKVSWRLLGR